jgi:hypothetical protein
MNWNILLVTKKINDVITGEGKRYTHIILKVFKKKYVIIFYHRRYKSFMKLIILLISKILNVY